MTRANLTVELLHSLPITHDFSVIFDFTLTSAQPAIEMENTAAEPNDAMIEIVM